MFRSSRVAIWVLSFALGSSLAAGQTHPLQTEEAATAPPGLAFEIGYDYIQDEPNFLTGKPRDRYDGPLLRLVYSPADNVEIDAEWVAHVRTPDDPDFGSVNDAGDLSFRSKVRLRDGGTGGLTVGARFTVTWPETWYDEGLGPNTLRSAVQLLLTHPVDPFRVHMNVGFGIDDQAQKAHTQSDFFVFGLAGEWHATRPLSVVAEWAGRTGTARPGNDEHSELRAGVRLDGRLVGLDVLGLDSLGVDAALRRGLGAADGGIGFTVGLTGAFRRSRAK